jgi:F-type H+-transporting ATPase subunit c
MENLYSLAPLAMSGASLGGAIAIAIVAGKAIDAIARQPEQLNNIRAFMIIGFAFIEATVLYSLVIVFMAMAK